MEDYIAPHSWASRRLMVRNRCNQGPMVENANNLPLELLNRVPCGLFPGPSDFRSSLADPIGGPGR